MYEFYTRLDNPVLCVLTGFDGVLIGNDVDYSARNQGSDNHYSGQQNCHVLIHYRESSRG
uniref:Uncharacterized protein n=1 Tax=Arion vulgaris TaxID=1028688 RepID=A0A0B7AK35_9EUPU